MSAENIYQPHVTLAGVRLPEHAPTAELAAVARFKISWGAASWFENVDPAVLDMTLIDPDGDMIAAAQNQPITITRDPDEAIVFDGTVDEVTSELGRVKDPNTGDPREVWFHTIRAYDRLAGLARDRRRGVLYNSRDIYPERMHWGPCFMNERKRDIQDRTRIPIIFQRGSIDAYDGASPILIYPVAAYERQQVVSLLTVLRQTARITNMFNRPYYIPAEGVIRFIALRPYLYPDLGMTNGEVPNATGWIMLESWSTKLLYGNQWTSKDGIRASNTLREQATRIELAMRTTRPTSFVTANTDRYMENVETAQAIDAVTKAAQQMTVKLESDYEYSAWASNDYAIDERNALDSMKLIYGLPQISPISHRFDKHAADPELAALFLTAAPPLNDEGQPVVFNLTESRTNMIPNAPPFSVLGGEIEYTHERGWEVTVTPVAAAVQSDRPTLGEVKSNIVLGRVGDSSLVADWQHVTYVS